jgi:peptidoglycan/LPS O-acetylase OafA/YrhL
VIWPQDLQATVTHTLSGRAPRNSLAEGIPAPENKIFYPALDGFRAAAALLVFVHHYVLAHLPPALRWGWAGVDVFFVLSGFLITGILFDTRESPHRLRNFYSRRALRIFPLYYGVAIVVLLTTPLFHWMWSRIWVLGPLYLLNYARYVHPVATHSGDLLFSGSLKLPLAFGHFWSLCVEEQFYLVWPLVVFLVRDRVRLRNLCVAAVFVVPLLRWAAVSVVPPQFLAYDLLYRATPFRVDALLLGGAVALMLRGPEAARLRRLAVPLLIASTLALALAWLVAVRVLHQSSAADTTVPWISTLGFSLIDLIAAAVLLLTLQPGNLFFRAFSFRPLRWLGQMSYGFYVFHYLPIVFYDHLFDRVTRHAWILEAVFAFVVTVCLSYVSFRFFEAPFLRLKDRFTL